LLFDAETQFAEDDCLADCLFRDVVDPPLLENRVSNVPSRTGGGRHFIQKLRWYFVCLRHCGGTANFANFSKSIFRAVNGYGVTALLCLQLILQATRAAIT